MRSSFSRSTVTRVAVLIAVGVGLVITVIAYSKHTDDAPPHRESEDSKGRKLVTHDDDSQSEIVLQAAEYLRVTFNSERRVLCKSAPLFTAGGEIQVFHRLARANRLIEYGIEITFGNSTFYVKVAVISNISESNSSTAFKLLWSAPAPCENSVHDQLAISSKSEFNIEYTFPRKRSAYLCFGV